MNIPIEFLFDSNYWLMVFLACNVVALISLILDLCIALYYKDNNLVGTPTYYVFWYFYVITEIPRGMYAI